MWWARTKDKGYGDWIPTGCADLYDAKDYIELHYRTPVFGAKVHVREWLKL